ncbi:cell division control protein 6 CDC6 [Gracilaria domingensis]|nr:cell division control protein 6 CDC6 [Gracilaria domingensis]
MTRSSPSRRRSTRLARGAASQADPRRAPLSVGRVRKRRVAAAARQKPLALGLRGAKHAPGDVASELFPLPTSPCSSRADDSLMPDASEAGPVSPVENRVNSMSLSFEPEGLPVGREKEAHTLIQLLRESLSPHKPSKSVYVCGTPGTGKTFTVTKVINHLRTATPSQVIDLTSDSESFSDDMQCSPLQFQNVWVNCANLQKPSHLYDRIAHSLNLSTSDVTARTAIQNYASSCNQPVLVVLDEVDFLTSRDQMLLYTAFEWPHIPSSQFTVIGIANSIDLPVRLLPWLRAAGCMPCVLCFKPYASDALQSIVAQRLQACSGAGLDHIAVMLAAKKVAAASGDARLMLDVCNEAKARLCEQPDAKAISLVAAIIDRRGGLSAAVDTIRQLPRQQQIALCVAANATMTPGSAKANKKATLGGLYDAFVSMCEKVHISRLPFSDFADMCCNALAHHGLLDVPVGKSRGSKSVRTLRGRAVRLKVPVDDVRAGVAEKGFLPFLVKK